VAQTEDDAFHEIQLNGKQLVFLFMAATAVSVVIFLLGVLVGRGVRAERTVAEASVANAGDVTPQAPIAAVPPPAASDPTKAAAPGESSEEPNVLEQLGKTKPAPEELKNPEKAPAARVATPAPPAEKPAPVIEKKLAPAPPAVVEKKPAPVEAPKPAQPVRAVDTHGEPSGSGFAVQVAALNARSEADAIVKRLSSKGYSAYVLAPASGTPSVFRVRVGKFNTRREADTVAAKLQKEEQFKPWVTR